MNIFRQIEVACRVAARSRARRRRCIMAQIEREVQAAYRYGHEPEVWAIKAVAFLRNG